MTTPTTTTSTFQGRLAALARSQSPRLAGRLARREFDREIAILLAIIAFYGPELATVGVMV